MHHERWDEAECGLKEPHRHESTVPLRCGDPGATPWIPAGVVALMGHPKRVLVVEDYYIIAEMYRSFIEGAGYQVLGPVATVAGALKILDSEVPDVAILDLSLGGSLVTDVAERLRSLGIPFFFLTALADLSVLPEEFRGHAVVGKPADRSAIIAALELELAH